ncbi:chemotaxis protein CheW [Brenneria goodwinii]|uniref:chemotaxis protein CheW n=1 Tax=Brenneria goodwinii TaxID=1109412 RepID=UPI0036E7FC2C
MTGFPKPSPPSDKQILRQRAIVLAKTADEPAVRAETLDMVVFRIGSERWAVESRYVSGVIDTQRLAVLPRVPPFVRGVVYARGMVVAVLDLGRLIGLDEQALDDLHRIVLVASGEHRIGLLAGMEVNVQQVAVADIGAVTDTPGIPGPERLKGVTADGLIVLDVERLCADVRIVINDE